MAGLDESRRSDFIAMLQDVGSEQDREDLINHLDPVQLCTETIRTIQMVSEALLLRERDMPLSGQPFSGCCDTLVARCKQASSTLTSIESHLSSASFMSICQPLAQLAETISVITEAVAQAVYMVAEKNPNCKKAKPGIVDNYPLSRGRLAVQLAVDSFQRSSITPKQVMAVSAVIATHLEALREQCKMAAELCEDDMVGFQFKACGRGLSGATSMLVAAVKSYIDMPTDQSRLSLQAFSTPLLASIDSLLMYVHSSDAFLGAPFCTAYLQAHGQVPARPSSDGMPGEPPRMSREVAELIQPIQAAALSVVSATTLFLGAVKTILTQPNDDKVHNQLRKYGVAIDDALDQLTKSIKACREADIVYDPANE